MNSCPDAPTISCVMPVYNSEAHVETAIRSVLAQSFDDFEFIIVDDGSVDGTGEILERFAKEDNRVRVLRNGANKGIAVSLNRGIEAALGRYIARMDADDISHPRRFGRQIAFLDKNAKTDVLGTFAEVCRLDGTHIRYHRPPTQYEDILLELCWGNAFVHGSVMLRNSGYRYDPNFRYAQDYRLFTQIALQRRVANLPENLYTWMDSPSTVTRTKGKEQRALTDRASEDYRQSLLASDLFPYAVLRAMLYRGRGAHTYREDIWNRLAALEKPERERLRDFVVTRTPYHRIGLRNLLENRRLLTAILGFSGYCFFAMRSVAAKGSNRAQYATPQTSARVNARISR